MFNTFFSLICGILSVYTVTVNPLSAHSIAVIKPIMPDPRILTLLSVGLAFTAKSAASIPQAGARETPAPP